MIGCYDFFTGEGYLPNPPPDPASQPTSTPTTAPSCKARDWNPSRISYASLAEDPDNTDSHELCFLFTMNDSEVNKVVITGQSIGYPQFGGYETTSMSEEISTYYVHISTGNA